MNFSFFAFLSLFTFTSSMSSGDKKDASVGTLHMEVLAQRLSNLVLVLLVVAAVALYVGALVGGVFAPNPRIRQSDVLESMEPNSTWQGTLLSRPA